MTQEPKGSDLNAVDLHVPDVEEKHREEPAPIRPAEDYVVAFGGLALPAVMDMDKVRLDSLIVGAGGDLNLIVIGAKSERLAQRAHRHQHVGAGQFSALLGLKGESRNGQDHQENQLLNHGQ